MNASATQNWRIDVHHHVVPPRYADRSMPIAIPDTEAQLRSMDSWRIRAAHYLAHAQSRTEQYRPAMRRRA
jgi:hypothetical protein